MDERRTANFRAAISGINNDKFQISFKKTTADGNQQQQQCSVGRIAAVVARFFDVSQQEAKKLALGAISIVRNLEQHEHRVHAVGGASFVARLRNLSTTDTCRGTQSTSSCRAASENSGFRHADVPKKATDRQKDVRSAVPTFGMRRDVKLQESHALPQALHERVATRERVGRQKPLQNNTNHLFRCRNRRISRLLQRRNTSHSTTIYYSWHMSHSRLHNQTQSTRSLSETLRRRSTCRKETFL